MNDSDAYCCDQCEKENGNFYVKDAHAVEYHFCSWECLTIHSWLMAEWENQWKHTTPIATILSTRTKTGKVVPFRHEYE